MRGRKSSDSPNRTSVSKMPSMVKRYTESHFFLPQNHSMTGQTMSSTMKVVRHSVSSSAIRFNGIRAAYKPRSGVSSLFTML